MYKICVSFFAIALFLATSPALASQNFSTSLGGDKPYNSSFTLLGGVKRMPSQDWAPLEKPILLGVDYDYTSSRWPVSLTAALFYGVDDGTIEGVNADQWILETHLGLRKVWRELNWFVPYVGGGLALGMANIAIGDNADAGYGLGGWVGGGIRFCPVRAVFLGIDARYSGLALDMGSYTVDGGGIYTLVSVGVNF